MTATAAKDYYRWGVLGLVMTGTFMAILDSSIVNVVLPHIMSAFGVNQQQIEWVSTGFMIAMAVTMPLVAWLVNRLGHKVLYLTSLALFVLGSALCAFAWSYNVLIASRILQAVGGGAIQPVGMAIVADLFAPHERGRALGIWGTGIMIGPALGPTLGGYLADIFNWRAVFSINIPIGIITVLMGMMFIRKDVKEREVQPFDRWGFLFLAMFLIGSLLGLAKGQIKGWTSTYVLVSFATALIGIVMFIAAELTVRYPLFELSLLKYRNFTLSMLLSVFRGVGLFGGIFLLPIFLQNLAGYTTIETGLWMMSGAVTIAFMMPIAGRLSDMYPPRGLTIIGTVMTGISLIIYGYLDPISGAGMIIGPQVLRGAGLAFMMAPLMTAALNAVPNDKVAVVSSFLNISRSVGGSFGIALVNQIVTASARGHEVRIASLFSTQSVAMQRAIEHFTTSPLLHAYLTTQTNPQAGLGLAAMTIMYKANALAFQNGFVFGGVVVFIGIPLCLFLEPSTHHETHSG